MIACSRDCTAELERRVAQAWKAFYKHSALLQCRAIPVGRRLETLRKLVLPALVYNLGTCHLTSKQLLRLRGVEDKMARRVLRWRLPRNTAIDPSTDTADYMAISAVRLQRIRAWYGWKRWDEEALYCAYKWAGHVVRLTARAPQRLVGQALLYRGSEYLQRVKSLYGHQGHASRFHVWWWEQMFTSWRGIDWKSCALQGEVWEDSANSWLRGRVQQ